MIRRLQCGLQSRYRPLLLLAAVFLGVSTITRVVLYLQHAAELPTPILSSAPVLAVGLFYDLVTTAYLLAAPALLLMLSPRRLLAARWGRALVLVPLFASTFGLIYLGAVEYFFFDEFGARFNFIAVEYLIYPHEVFVNIWQSYPVAWVVAAVTAITALIAWRHGPRVGAALSRGAGRDGRYAVPAALALAIVPVHVTVDVSTGRFSDNHIANELSLNGVYAFFNAASHMDLDYRDYYLAGDGADAAQRVQRLLAQPNARFAARAETPTARHVDNPGPARPLHVIVLLEESLGAEFVGAYGAKKSLTPNIDRLAGDGVLFERVYATGTRTVRGMEAVSASFPPLPPESVVKRRHNEGLFNWSQVMRDNGYSPTFIYGGYGSFDNMNAFFGANGYRVIDRTDMGEPKFANIWGVSDEDLFREALAEFDRQVARGERVFSIVMSTSNHKPYTFPAGVPGVPEEGGGREAGVRYADYAIGRFMAGLQQRPWYRDTVVVIVADHGARVYGKQDFPLPSYEIPLLVHAPAHFAPRRIDALASQMDVMPTVLGMLGISYDTVGYGRDVLATTGRRYVVLNHNRDIALFDGEHLTELTFRKGSRSLVYDRAHNLQQPVPQDEERVRDAVAVFQSAFDAWAGGRYSLAAARASSSSATAATPDRKRIPHG